jgi:ComF family protein
MFNFISDILPKPVCMLCQQSLGQFQRICQDCVTQLPWLGAACALCAQSLENGQTHCGACQKNPPPYDRLWVALDYASPIDKLILGGKFSRRLLNLSVLAELFMVYWQQQSAQLPEVIIPVPLHAQRLRERGYNQALELARIISRQQGVPLDFHSIQRSKTTLAQASLPASLRRGNMDSAFTLTRPLPYSRVALVDDVFTTGNTVRALSQLLRQAKVGHIEVYCMAHAALGPNGY